MSEAFQENQNKDLFVTGKSSHSGSEPEDSVIIKARFYTLSHRQPQTNTFCYVKKLHEGLPPPSRNRVKYLFLLPLFIVLCKTKNFKK